MSDAPASSDLVHYGHLDEEAVKAGEVQAHLWAIGRPIDVEDALIGATALARGLVLVSSNVAHFARIPNLRVVDWMGD